MSAVYAIVRSLWQVSWRCCPVGPCEKVGDRQSRPMNRNWRVALCPQLMMEERRRRTDWPTILGLWPGRRWP